MCRELCRWELGVRMGYLLMTSETFRVDNLESGVVGGACGAVDKDDLSMNGSNKYQACPESKDTKVLNM